MLEHTFFEKFAMHVQKNFSFKIKYADKGIQEKSLHKK